MIRLRDLLVENPENRVNLMKVQAVIEKLYPELGNDQAKKIMELCTDAHLMASQLNTKPFVRTEVSLMEWKLLVAAMNAKLAELKEEVVRVCEQRNIDCRTVVKALDEVLVY